MGVVLVWAQFLLFLVALMTGILYDVGLMLKAERTYYGQWHLVERLQRPHGCEMSVKQQVHKSGMYDVVVVMTKGEFVAPDTLCQLKYGLAAIP